MYEFDECDHKATTHGHLATHFKIGSVVWVLELCEVARKILTE